MRTLIYVPIIHTPADLGSLAEHVKERGVMHLGEDIWEKHRKAVEGFWVAVTAYFASMNVAGMKIYQDGMVAEGEVGHKIVEEGVKLGSKNYELLSMLLKNGAVLVKTEDFRFVKEERDRLVEITQAKSTLRKLIAFLKYKLVKNRLLNKRDEYIARRINETLNRDEKAIAFIGAYHDIKRYLPRGIIVIEVKAAKKVREYHSLLPFYNKNKKRFERLGKYIAAKVVV